MLPAAGNEGWTTSLVNHLWQSTIVAAIAWLLVLSLRNNHARTRYWVWMIASVKFLFPFSLFIAAGEALRPTAAIPMKSPALAAAMEQIAQPFPQTQSFAATGAAVASHSSNIVPLLLLAVWAFRSCIVAFSWWRKWRQIRAAVRAASPAAIPAGVPVLWASSLLEPGVVGILRPVMVLPEGIRNRLTSAQLDAIVAHEMCHVRRRDNLTFAIHMVVETLFWFHPLVWWIRARLVEERELACDESVLQAGNEAEVYAEGILNVCKFYVESPLTCVSGVSGSDLKKRIIRIMSERVASQLGMCRKILLAAACFVVIATPTAIGIFHAGQTAVLARAQAASAMATAPLLGADGEPLTFDVVSVREDKSIPTPQDPPQFGPTADGYVLRNLTVMIPILAAYIPSQGGDAAVFNVDQITGVPGWLSSTRYDINAKVSEADLPKWKDPALQPAMLRAMLQAILAERFRLAVHHGMKENPIFELTVTKNGPKFKPSETTALANIRQKYPSARAIIGGTIVAEGPNPGQTMLFGVTMPVLSTFLSHMAGRPIQDKTGLTGKYDITYRIELPGLSQTSSAIAEVPELDSQIFTLVRDQLGLRLKSAKGEVESLVIDHIEQPSPN